MNALWSSRGWRATLLTPIAGLFYLVVLVRTALYKWGWLNSVPSSVPVIVIGNISVGGTGKTPVVSVVVKKLQLAGFKPGIVSRGYGAVPAKEARLINADTPVAYAGDEPAMLARDTGVPVCICTNRALAVEHIVRRSGVDVVVSDDGLQHYTMQRDIEVAVVDGQRRLGNGWLLPAGPLREPVSRLGHVDIVAIQHMPNTVQEDKDRARDSLHLLKDHHVGIGCFHLDITSIVSLHTHEQTLLSEFSGCRVHAVAGIGNPHRFFTSLRNAGIEVVEHAMADHHQYVPDDVQFEENIPVLMTAKDAVKICELNIDMANLFEVSVTAMLDTELDAKLDEAIDQLLSTLQ